MILQDALLVDGQHGSKTERGDFLKKSYPMNGASRELRESETQSKRDALIRVSRVGAESPDVYLAYSGSRSRSVFLCLGGGEHAQAPKNISFSRTRRSVRSV
jgi:hypothetical protein